jgi:glycosyltransferase involved in cell wall biosynthesis
MKIGLDGRLWKETGVGRYIRALVTELAKVSTPHTFTIFLQKPEYETLVLPANWQKIEANVRWHTALEQIVMPRLYKAAKLDLLHIPYFAVPLATPKPFIVTIHDLTISQFATGKATTLPQPLYLLKRLGYTYTIKNAVSRADKIIAPSLWVKNQLLDLLQVPETKLAVTYESGEFEEAASKEKINTPAQYILYVGNAHPHKNLSALLAAFALLAKTQPLLQLVLIGKTDYFYNQLQREIKQLPCAHQVQCRGEISTKELIHWYKNAACFVFPSFSEGFGIPGLEALTAGCPLVASDILVFHEIYGSAAVYFDPRNHQELATRLSELLTNSAQSKKMSQLGTEWVKKYSWLKMTKETLALYESCDRL